jgi:hypothetical protein
MLRVLAAAVLTAESTGGTPVPRGMGILPMPGRTEGPGS